MFSVIIPVHNKLPHLERSINSVLNQSFQKFEILLIDDASTDGSSDKIKKFNDPRIKRYTRDRPGPGGYAARNLGIQNAKYDWICFLDADDEWSPDFLYEFNKAIEHNPDVFFFSCKWESKREDDIIHDFCNNSNLSKVYSHFSLIDYLNDRKFVWTCALVVHKDIIHKAKGFPDDGICKRGGDVDTWIRWLYNNENNLYINKVLAYYYRDTINQVTMVPNKHFCAYETLMVIYNAEPNNKKLRKSISLFVNKFLYGMLYRQVKSGLAIDYVQIKKMFLDYYSISRIAKLLLLRLKNILE